MSAMNTYISYVEKNKNQTGIITTTKKKIVLVYNYINKPQILFVRHAKSHLYFIWRDDDVNIG